MRNDSLHLRFRRRYIQRYPLQKCDGLGGANHFAPYAFGSGGDAKERNAMRRRGHGLTREVRKNSHLLWLRRVCYMVDEFLLRRIFQTSL